MGIYDKDCGNFKFPWECEEKPSRKKTCWPNSGVELDLVADKLRYGNPTKKEKVFAARIVTAYSRLITCPCGEREAVVEKLRLEREKENG
jgi:hypothetical protein